MESKLLGKWRVAEDGYREARGFRLSGHMTEVLWGFDILFEQSFGGSESFGHALYEKMQLTVDFDEFKKRCLLAVAFHDLGKAGGEFQKMLFDLEKHYQATGEAPRGARYKQAYRHEFASGLLMFHHPEIRAYLEAVVGKGRPFLSVLGGAAGHHLKSTPDRGAGGFENREDKWTPKPVYLGQWASGVSPLLTRRGLPALPALKDIQCPEYMKTKDAINKAWRTIKVAANSTASRNTGDRGDKTDAAIKWITILADVFGSVDKNKGETVLDVRKRIADELKRMGEPVDCDPIDRVRKKLKYSHPELNAMQESAANTKGNLIITASTGGGKTIAALAWASVCPDTRTIFAAHTTDAASVLHKDYAMSADIVKHSRAWLDLTWTPTPEDNERDEKEAAEDAAATMSLFSDGTAPMTFCTADQVLGLPAFYRKSIMWLPYLLSSQIIFDEIHSYDRHMRGWYERFLSYFPGIRTAHLSATLPRRAVARLQTLTRASYDPTPYETSVATNTPRYRVVVLDTPPEVMEPRCLWFTNTVDRCQAKAAHFGAVAYHSRFRYEDRKNAKDSLISGFRQQGSDVRVVATQVAEMSLDVDADVMVSEVAPPASIIQRMGRLNRGPTPSGVRTLYVYPHQAEPTPDGRDHHGFPYCEDDDWVVQYEEWRQWLKSLEGRDISQSDLETAFQAYMDRQQDEDARATHPSLVQTERYSVRDSGTTTTVLLAADIAKIEEAVSKNPAKKEAITRLLIQKYEVPIVLKFTRERELINAGHVYPPGSRNPHPVVQPVDGTYSADLGWIPNRPPASASVT